jgi:multiple sugar transport system permease protein
MLPQIKVLQSKKELRYFQEALTGWLMALPAILLIFIFLIVPFFMAFGLSFTNQRLISPNPTEFVGMRNFSRLLTMKIIKLTPLKEESTNQYQRDPEGNLIYPELRDITRNPDSPELKGLREFKSWYKDDVKVVLMARDLVFLRALVNTFIFVIIIAPLQGGLALLLALLLNKKLRGINIFRAIYFMPVVVSMVVVSLLWRFIYDGENGLLNTLLNTLTLGNFEAVNWIGNPKTALGSILFMSCWQGVGFHMVIWLAGLQNIPGSLYEAASMDGANKSQEFRFITWPGLRNTMTFVLLIITMQAFGLYIQIDVMTSGGPLDSTQSVIFQAVQRGYGKQDIAGGSAISVVFFMIVLSVSIMQRYFTREKE